jgi:ATP-binding cassette, subfamily B, bacterial
LPAFCAAAGDQGLPISSGEAVNRFSTDIGEVSDFPLWLPRSGWQVGGGSDSHRYHGAHQSDHHAGHLCTAGQYHPHHPPGMGPHYRYSRASGRAADAVSGYLSEIFDAVQAIKVAGAEEGVVERYAVLE